MIVYETPTVTIEYNKEKSQIIQKWRGFSTSDTFREAIMKTSEFGRQNLVTSVISDAREQKIVKAEDIQFAVSRMPQIAFANIKAMAFIMPKNAFAELSVKRFGTEAHLEFVNYFDSMEKAQTWIDTMI